MATVGYIQSLTADDNAVQLAAILADRLGKAYIALPRGEKTPPLPEGVETFFGPEDPVERILAFAVTTDGADIFRVPSLCPPAELTIEKIDGLLKVFGEEKADLCYDPSLPRQYSFEITSAGAFPKIKARVGKPFTYNRHYLYMLHNLDGFRITSNLPPAERKKQRKLDSRFWFHSIDFGNGVRSNGFTDSRRLLNTFEKVDGFRGQRVLDVAMNDGLYSFLAEQRGADEVVGIEVDDLSQQDLGRSSAREEFYRIMTGLFGDRKHKNLSAGNFAAARELLGSTVERREKTVYQLDPEEEGTFDAVFMFGLLYHVLDPMLALTRVRDVCRGTMYLQTMVDPEPSQTPLMKFTEGTLYVPELKFHDPTNWWIPNMPCLRGMLRTAGFGEIEELDVGDGFAFLACR